MVGPSFRSISYMPTVILLGGTSDASLIDAKWEGTALAPALDSANPDDYFLFVAADNDFNTCGSPYELSMLSIY